VLVSEENVTRYVNCVGLVPIFLHLTIEKDLNSM